MGGWGGALTDITITRFIDLSQYQHLNRQTPPISITLCFPEGQRSEPSRSQAARANPSLFTTCNTGATLTETLCQRGGKKAKCTFRFLFVCLFVQFHGWRLRVTPSSGVTCVCSIWARLSVNQGAGVQSRGVSPTPARRLRL